MIRSGACWIAWARPRGPAMRRCNCRATPTPTSMRTTPAALRRVLKGARPRDPSFDYVMWRRELWPTLQRVNRNAALAPLLEYEAGSPRLYAMLYHRDLATITGRVRGGM